MILPENILKCMTPGERAKHGAAGLTATEAQEKYALKTERAMHDEVEKWLRLQGIPFIHSRTDKKSTIRLGWPDFTCLYRLLTPGWLQTPATCCCIELKLPTGELSPAQRECIDELTTAGVPVLVAMSAKQAIDFVIEHLLR